MTGDELRQLREKAGLTQMGLADELGWTGKGRDQTVSAYETGRNPIGARLARTLTLLFESLTVSK